MNLTVPDDGEFHLVANKPSNGGGFQVYVNLTSAVIRLRGIDNFSTEAHILPNGNLVMKFWQNGLVHDSYFMNQDDDLSVGITPEELVKRWVAHHGHAHHEMGLRFFVRLFGVPRHLLWTAGELELFQLLGRLGIHPQERDARKWMEIPHFRHWEIQYKLHQGSGCGGFQGRPLVNFVFRRGEVTEQYFTCLLSRDNLSFVPIDNLSRLLEYTGSDPDRFHFHEIDCNAIRNYASPYFPKHRGELHALLMQAFGFTNRHRR